MSRLIQRLEQIGKASPAPLGFGRATRQEAPLSFVLLASCTSEKEVATIAKSPVDALLFTPSTVDVDALVSAASVLGTIPWGVRLSNGEQESVALFKEKGCDFIAFPADHLPLKALQGEELGRILVITENLEKEQAYVLEDLPLDATLTAQPLPSPITLEALMSLAAQRSHISKPFLLPLSDAPSSWELECLRDIGVEGLMLNMDEVGPDVLQILLDRIQALPRRKPRGEHSTAYLPQTPSRTPREHAHEEEEEEEELWPGEGG